MTILEQITEGLSRGRNEYENIIKQIESGDNQDRDTSSHHISEGSVLAHGDNLDFMVRLLAEGYRGRFRTIYIDPPFFTKSKFNAAVVVRDNNGAKHRVRHLAFDDRFERSVECYIENMSVRLLLMRDLLADDGTI